MSDNSKLVGIGVAAADDGGVRVPGADHVRGWGHHDADGVGSHHDVGGSRGEAHAHAYTADADDDAHGVDDVAVKQLHDLTETFCRKNLCKLV